MSAAVAVGWTYNDWQWPVLPNLKQGQDVKAVVLLSPALTFKTLNTATAVTSTQSPIREQVSLFLIAGAEDLPSVREVRRVYQQLERVRPKADKIEDKTLFIEDTLKTKLIGTKLLGEASLGVDQLIGEFIELRLVRQLLPWKDRTRS